MRMDNEVIKEEDQLKYLGVKFDTRFNFVKHVAEVKRKTESALASFRHLAGKNKLQKKVRQCMYSVALKTIITYAFPAWHGITAVQMEVLRTLERKALRFVHGDRGRVADSFRFIRNEQLYEETEFKRIDVVCIVRGVEYLRKATEHGNELARRYLGSGVRSGVGGMRYRSPARILEDFSEGVTEGGIVGLYHQRSHAVGTV